MENQEQTQEGVVSEATENVTEGTVQQEAGETANVGQEPSAELSEAPADETVQPESDGETLQEQPTEA